MDQKRIRYSYLLYLGLVQIRFSTGNIINNKFSYINPFKWVKLFKVLKQINALTDTLHNLPQFLAKDFVSFDEKCFLEMLTDYHNIFSKNDEINFKDNLQDDEVFNLWNIQRENIETKEPQNPRNNQPILVTPKSTILDGDYRTKIAIDKKEMIDVLMIK